MPSIIANEIIVFLFQVCTRILNLFDNVYVVIDK